MLGFAVLQLRTGVHLITVNVGATVAAADTGEGGNGVSVAITVTEKKQGDTQYRKKILLNIKYLLYIKCSSLYFQQLPQNGMLFYSMIWYCISIVMSCYVLYVCCIVCKYCMEKVLYVLCHHISLQFYL